MNFEVIQWLPLEVFLPFETVVEVAGIVWGNLLFAGSWRVATVGLLQRHRTGELGSQILIF